MSYELLIILGSKPLVDVKAHLSPTKFILPAGKVLVLHDDDDDDDGATSWVHASSIVTKIHVDGIWLKV